MVTTLIRLPEVIKRTGLSRSTIYYKLERHEFPRPVKLGERSIAWPEHLVEEWVQSRIEQCSAAASQ